VLKTLGFLGFCRFGKLSRDLPPRANRTKTPKRLLSWLLFSKIIDNTEHSIPGGPMSRSTSFFNFGSLVHLSVATVLAASAQHVFADTAKEPAKGECHGANSCKGKGECGGKGTSCAGTNACKGKGWITTTKAECEKKHGKWKAN
jgi:hypothetical protein